MSISVEVHGAVSVLRMDDGENRFNPGLLDGLDAALRPLEDGDGPRAAVLTGTGKFFSNGLDLEWMAGAGEGPAKASVERVQDLLARLLLAPFTVVAAVNGHAFAGGGMLALAADERIMRSDRGYFCLPEVDLGLPFTPGMSALIAARLAPAAAHRTMVTGARLTAEEALALGVVDGVAAEPDVLPTAIAHAEALAAKAGPTMAAIKTGLYAPAAELLRQPLG